MYKWRAIICHQWQPRALEHTSMWEDELDGLVQDCSNSSALAMESSLALSYQTDDDARRFASHLGLQNVRLFFKSTAIAKNDSFSRYSFQQQILRELQWKSACIFTWGSYWYM